MNAIKTSREDRRFDIFSYGILFLFLLLVAYPLYFVVIASISKPYDVLNGNVLFLPRNITFDGYMRIFRDDRIWTGYGNTIYYTVLGTFLNIALTMMLAFPLSRRTFSGTKAIMVLMLITMYVGGGLIPEYLLIKNLGLRDTRALIIILGAVSVYNVIIAVNFLKLNIPVELEQAAAIDGCSDFTFFFQIILPLSSAIIAVLVIYYGVGRWNDYFTAMIYLNKTEMFPLQLVLKSILVQTQSMTAMTDDIALMEEAHRITEQIKYGVIIIASAPILALYPFVQKYFIKGVMIGSIKG